jgi:hypothetical protein
MMPVGVTIAKKMIDNIIGVMTKDEISATANHPRLGHTSIFGNTRPSKVRTAPIGNVNLEISGNLLR